MTQQLRGSRGNNNGFYAPCRLVSDLQATERQEDKEKRTQERREDRLERQNQVVLQMRLHTALQVAIPSIKERGKPTPAKLLHSILQIAVAGA